jgi:predicted N-acetyltransferase YhbS
MRESPATRIRPLDAGRDGAAMVDLRCRAFGPLSGAEPAAWLGENSPALRDRRFLGLFDGQRLVGMARYHDMLQYWHGRTVPMAGVSSVAVAPEERGRGVGRELMTELLDAIAARGYPLSVLFPSTMPLYRSLGWEIAGTSHEAVFPAPALRPLAAPGQPAGVRRAGPEDAGLLRETMASAHAAARDCGPGLRDETSLRYALSQPQNYFYLAGDGVLCYTWRHGHDELFVFAAVAMSEHTTRALWAIVASNCWMADSVRARVGPADPVWWLTPDPVAGIVDHDDWMLRVVDPAAAIAARGFPPTADLVLPLHLTDPARPGNSGPWLLKISGGSGSLTPLASPGAGTQVVPDGGGPPLALGARGLAALYAGTPVATLRRTGLATAGSSTGDASLDGVFGAAPYTLDRF